ncbi:MAG TPA: GNAT family N-acetyltransferase [Desulfomonilaceae bacterium]|nr:GNAT family N-acetyltransferase [Desulfomonilaceae bacterium]
MQLRLMTTKDIPDAMRLKDIAGWNQTAEDWKRFLSADSEGCFVAEYDGRVVGTSATIVYEDRFAWIGMLIVDPLHRGKGLGTALLERAIQYLDSRRIPCMKLDATPQGKPLYEKLGFQSEYTVERWMLKRHREKKTVRKAPVKILDILQLDREIFGADRSKLLLSLTEEAPHFTLADGKEVDVAGYAFGRQGSLADHLGPWIARNKDVAATLLDEFLRLSQRDLVFVDCMTRNPWAAPLVKAHGFEFRRPLTRMFRGTNEYAGRPDLVLAIMGPEFG